MSETSELGVDRLALHGLGGADCEKGALVVELDVDDVIECVGEGHLRIYLEDK